MTTSATAILDTAFWVTSGAIVLLLVLSAFFSGSETALTAASRGKLRSLADRGNGGAQSALDITEDNERLIGSVLLGNNLVNILAASLATALFTRLFGESGVALATLVMTLLVLIFAEVLPKTYAITNPETAASRVSPVIRLVILVFSPIVSAVRALVRQVLGLFGVKTDPDTHILALQEEIAGAIQLGHSEGVVEKEHRDRILGALDLGDRYVEEIMLHRSQIEMLNADDDARDILEQCLASPHARRDANRLMLTGEPIKSQEAQRIGLIDEIAEGAEAVDAALHAMRAKVQKAAPGAVAATKMQIALAEQLEGDARKRSAADLFAQRMMSEEGREGVASFVEKRAPVWAVE